MVILTFAECTTTTVNHQLMTLGLSLMKLSTNTASKLVIYRSEGTEREKKGERKWGSWTHAKHLQQTHHDLTNKWGLSVIQ